MFAILVGILLLEDYFLRKKKDGDVGQDAPFMATLSVLNARVKGSYGRIDSSFTGSISPLRP